MKNTKLEFSLALLLIISILVGSFALESLSKKNQIIENQKSQITELQTQNNDLQIRNKKLWTRLGRVEWNYSQDRERYKIHIAELEKSDRFTEGFMKALVGGCLLDGSDIQYCVNGAGVLYEEKVYEIVIGDWDKMWERIKVFGKDIL